MKKRIFVFGALGMLLSCYGAWMLYDTVSCADRLRAEVDSRDGRYVARTYTKGCYADELISSTAMVSSRPEPFSMAVADQTVVLKFAELAADVSDNPHPPRLDWLDTGTLLIDYRQSLVLRLGCDRVVGRINHRRDVQIEYRGRCEPGS